jgi:Nuclease-related domain
MDKRRTDAGIAAERQMAFYLEEAFRRDPCVRLFHNVYFEGDAGVKHQIDHLVVHRLGMVIVESKSVATAVKVDVRGDWTRIRGNKEEGMPCPVAQAERQAIALKQLLEDRYDDLGLRDTKKLRKLHVSCVVAISDNGRWIDDRPVPQSSLPVYKADRIAARVQAEFQRHGNAIKLLSKSDIPYGRLEFGDASFEKLLTFVGSLKGTTSERRVATKPVSPSDGFTPMFANVAKAPSDLSEPGTEITTVKEVADIKPILSQPFACVSCGSPVGTAKAGVRGLAAYIKCSPCGKNNAAPTKCHHCANTISPTVATQGLVIQCDSCGHTLTIEPKVLTNSDK